MVELVSAWNPIPLLQFVLEYSIYLIARAILNFLHISTLPSACFASAAFGPCGLGFPQVARNDRSLIFKPASSMRSAAISADARVAKLTNAHLVLCIITTDLSLPYCSKYSLEIECEMKFTQSILPLDVYLKSASRISSSTPVMNNEVYVILDLVMTPMLIHSLAYNGLISWRLERR